MSIKIKKNWSALDNNLVFDLILGVDQAADASRLDNIASAIIHCEGDPNTKLMEIYKDIHTSFDYHFMSGIYVHGYLSLKQRRLLDGTGQGGVYGDLHFGHKGHSDEQHFEGFIAQVPIH
ncbi:MAG: hypothetical protein K0Q67_1654 [Cellvibrio sp.]|jgi:hypothetical protein|nr:hypothetical protein [Cellvibrio sp.]MDF3013996.1 hypothetical protein [Cellvibrio sp.]